ncbi:hypothetical protein [Paenibacillus sp. FSL R10-2748]
MRLKDKFAILTGAESVVEEIKAFGGEAIAVSVNVKNQKIF